MKALPVDFPPRNRHVRRGQVWSSKGGHYVFTSDVAATLSGELYVFFFDVGLEFIPFNERAFTIDTFRAEYPILIHGDS